VCVSSIRLTKFSLCNRPLKDDEKLPTPTHRSPTSNSLKSESAAVAKLNSKKAETKTSEPKAAAEKTSESSKKPAKKEKSKEKSKHSSKSKKKSTASDSIDLLISTEQQPRSEKDYNELVSPEHELAAGGSNGTEQQNEAAKKVQNLTLTLTGQYIVGCIMIIF
jgi:outer membrane biosynthesis protein TonB